MRILILLLLLLIIACSCRMTLGVYDPDPLYSRRMYTTPHIPQPGYWDLTPYYGWPGYYYNDPRLYRRERVIIIKPEAKPQPPAKRPDRGAPSPGTQYYNRGRRIQ